MLDIQSVQYAILETDGNLSVFAFPEKGRQFLPVTVIEDGWFSRENLKKAGKDEVWLGKILEEHNTTISGTMLLTVDGGGNVVWIRKEYRT